MINIGILYEMIETNVYNGESQMRNAWLRLGRPIANVPDIS